MGTLLSWGASAVFRMPPIPKELDRIIEQAAETLDADRTVLISMDIPSRKVKSVIKAGPDAGRLELPPLDEYYEELEKGLTGWVIAQRETAFSPKNRPDPRESPEVQEARRINEAGSLVVSPVFSKGHFFGTLTAIKHVSKRDFYEEEIEMMKTFASFVSLQLEKRDQNPG